MWQASGPGEMILEGEADPGADRVDVDAKSVVRGGKPPPEPPPYDYASSRAATYPPIAEQIDMLWHAMDADPAKRLEPFYSRIKAVKRAFPRDGDGSPAIVYGVEGL